MSEQTTPNTAPNGRRRDNPIESLIQTALEKIRQISDANTVIGEPIQAPNGTQIIPVCKVSMGFAAGGSDFPSKTPKELFGGGTGGGLTVQPLAFLVIHATGEVRVLGIPTANSTADRIVNMVPGVIDQVSGLFHRESRPDMAGPMSEDDITF